MRLRDVRLRALGDAPDAFGATLRQESEYDEGAWRRLGSMGAWWVACDGGADVGVIAGGHHDDARVRWVYSMWVDEAHRGTGVAALLLDEVVRWARGEGVATLGLDVADRVPRARSFYERYGFVANGRVAPMPRDASILLAEMHLGLGDLAGSPP